MGNKIIGDHFIIPAEPISRIFDNLWMGGLPPIGRGVQENFDCLVLAAIEHQNANNYPGVKVELAPLRDDGSVMTKQEMKYAVKTAGKVIRWLNNGLSVLVTCYAGKNRSGLICALVLCCGMAKLSPEEAIRIIRSARGSNALSNPQFVSFLDSFCRSMS